MRDREFPTAILARLTTSFSCAQLQDRNRSRSRFVRFIEDLGKVTLNSRNVHWSLEISDVTTARLKAHVRQPRPSPLPAQPTRPLSPIYSPSLFTIPTTVNDRRDEVPRNA